MNPPHNSSPLETLIRARAQRLAQPHPASRDAIRAACAAASPPQTAPAAGRKRWSNPARLAGWGSLAACWLAVLSLNHQTHAINAGITPPGGSLPFSAQPEGVLFWQPPDLAALSFLPPPRPLKSAPPPPVRTRKGRWPDQSFNLPPDGNSGWLV